MIGSNPTACTCPSGDGSLRHPCPAHSGNCISDAAPFDLVAHLERQRYFSAHTFGPGSRAAGIVDHIRKELLEIEADPGDLREWVDVIILALDGAWRSGATPQEIITAIVAKQTKNEGRTWPHWSTIPADRAIEHDRSGENHVVDANNKVGAAEEAVAIEPFAYVDISETSADLGFPRDTAKAKQALHGLPLGLHPLYLNASVADEPNLFWNDADPERAFDSIIELISQKWENGSAVAGDVMEVQQAIRLPNVKVRVVESKGDGVDYENIQATSAEVGS